MIMTKGHIEHLISMSALLSLEVFYKKTKRFSISSCKKGLFTFQNFLDVVSCLFTFQNVLQVFHNDTRMFSKSKQNKYFTMKTFCKYFTMKTFCKYFTMNLQLNT